MMSPCSHFWICGDENGTGASRKRQKVSVQTNDPTFDSSLVLILLEKEMYAETAATQRAPNSPKWKFSRREGVWKVAELRPSLP